MTREEYIKLYEEFLNYLEIFNYSIIEDHLIYDNDFKTIIGPLGEVFDRYIDGVYEQSK
jgi:hypothetical protein